MCNVFVVWRSLAVYCAAACYGVALAQDAGSSVVPGGELATPLGLVLSAAIVRGWTPTVRVIHAKEDK